MSAKIPDNTETLVVNSLVDRFKATFADTMQMEVSDLNRLYAKDVEFKDPIHTIKGLDNLQSYMDNLCSNLDTCRFIYHTESLGEGRAFIKWDMYFSHPKLKKARTETGEHCVRGISEVHFDSRIYYQEDVYDMGAMIYENVPVIGGVTSWLKKRLAKI